MPTVPDLSCVVFRKRHRENRETVSIVKPQLIITRISWSYGKLFDFKIPASRAELNEREAPGKGVTARPPKRLAQMRSVSHALISTFQKHRSKNVNWYDLAACTSVADIQGVQWTPENEEKI